MGNRMNTRKAIFYEGFYIEFLTIVVLVLSYVVNIPLLTLAAFAFACLLVFFSDYEKSIYYIAFYASFAGIFVYNGKHMYFVMIALFIMKSLIAGKMHRYTLVYYLLIVSYSVLFSDFKGDYSFARILGTILLFAIPLVAFSSNEIDCRLFMRHYIMGFFIQTIIGFFVSEIPTMYSLFGVDLMWTQTYQQVTRFFGLAYDSNFYALSNYIIIAYLLFTFEKLDLFRAGVSAFFVISGMQTISKSYILVVCVLLLCCFIRNASSIKNVLLFVCIGLIGVYIFTIFSQNQGFNAIELTASRFSVGEGFAENTTGRVDIWKEYMEMFREAGAKELLFGYGFNANVIKAAHNTIIEFVFYYGLIGLMLWGAYFVHCWKLFQFSKVASEFKTPMVSIAFFIGIFFLSAFTYESFWIGIVMALMTLGKKESRENQCVIV